MTTLGMYCKAYEVATLRQFEQWTTGVTVSAREFNDDDVLFVQEDFTVTDGVFLENVVFDQVTPEWKEFCKTQLGFEVPSHITAN
ncbi:MAG TPA: hypothetical protein VF290_17845 [Pyrinomonadaceae bacterium]